MRYKPLVSVILPVYNAQKYLAEAIESILSQTLKDFELILINDASTDNTLTIINSFKKKDKRIRVIHNKKNLLMAQSLNLGIKKAKADLIARMDQDDISLPERLEIQYKFLKSHPDIAIVGNDIFIIDEKGNIIGKRTYPITSSGLKYIMFRYSPFAHPTVMFLKLAYQKVKGYDPETYPCDDIDFWFRLGKEYKFASIPKRLFKYRLTITSSSHNNVLKTEVMGFKIKLKAIKKYKYKPTVFDIIYNIIQFVTAWFMPTRQRIFLYNFLRSRKII